MCYHVILTQPSYAITHAVFYMDLFHIVILWGSISLFLTVCLAIMNTSLLSCMTQILLTVGIESAAIACDVMLLNGMSPVTITLV